MELFSLLFCGISSLDDLFCKKARSEGDKFETEEEEMAEEIKILPMWKCLLYIVGGMIAIKFGGDFVVNGASSIAAGFGLSQTLIGLTIVALGTSLPELVTSIVAARKMKLIWHSEM